jgi:hypothetical protein
MFKKKIELVYEHRETHTHDTQVELHKSAEANLLHITVSDKVCIAIFTMNARFQMVFFITNYTWNLPASADSSANALVVPVACAWGQ